MNESQLVDWYIKNRPTYKRLANKVESFLIEVFDMNLIGYHMVTSRAKEIDSLRTKNNNKKYSNPTSEIQDFAGIRVITYVEDELAEVCKVIEENFDIDTQNSTNKSEALGVDRVGYQSVHYIATLKQDRLVLPEYKQYKGRCFEIQVRTILQHAWAEIEHDRNYKFTGKLPDELSRRFKVLAGVLELADREFNEISRSIDKINTSVDEGAKTGNLDIALSSTSLSQFLTLKFNSLIEEMGELHHDSEGILITELDTFGIKTLADLDQIIPSDIEKFYRASYPEFISEFGMIRSLMIMKDYNKYFSTITPEWPYWSSESSHADENFVLDYFKKHNVDWDDIYKKYNISFTDAEKS